MKIQWSKRASPFLLVFVLLVGSGSVSGIHSSAFAHPPASIDSREAKRTFESKNFTSIIAELDKIRLDKKALDDNSIIREVVSLYDGINKISFSASEKVALKKKIIRVLLKARVPLSTETLERISLTDKNPYIRHHAKDWLTNKRTSTISEQIDTSRYILVDGKGMTYAQAYPILMKKIESSSIEQRIDGVKLLGRYGALLKDKPIIDELIDLYHATPKVPDKTYREYSESEEKNLTLKGEILLTLAISGTPSGKDLLNKSKTSTNRYIRLAADRIQTLLTTGSISMSAQPENTKAKGEPLYLMLGKAVPKHEALALIKRALQSNNGKEIKNMIDDIGIDPSLIKGTDVYNSLSELLVRISQKGVPKSWKLTADETTQVKDRMFFDLRYSTDPRMSDVVAKLKNTNDHEIKYLVRQYRIDNAK